VALSHGGLEYKMCVPRIGQCTHSAVSVFDVILSIRNEEKLSTTACSVLKSLCVHTCAGCICSMINPFLKDQIQATTERRQGDRKGTGIAIDYRCPQGQGVGHHMAQNKGRQLTSFEIYSPCVLRKNLREIQISLNKLVRTDLR